MSTTIGTTTPSLTSGQLAIVTKVQKHQKLTLAEEISLGDLLRSWVGARRAGSGSATQTTGDNTGTTTGTRQISGGITFETLTSSTRLKIKGGAVVTVSSDTGAPAVKTVLADGTAVETQFDSDGKPSGAKVTLPNGDIVTTSTNDGMAVTTLQHGKDAPVILKPGTFRESGKATIQVGFDGKATITSGDNSTIVTNVTGDTTTTLANKSSDGDVTTISSDGSVSQMSASGTEIVTTPDGEQKNVSTGRGFADGSTVRIDPNTGATSRTLSPGGQKITYSTSGDDSSTLLLNFPPANTFNGATISTSFDSNNSPTGTIITISRGKDGPETQITIANGVTQYTDEKGNVVNVIKGAVATDLKDGTKIKTDNFGNTTVTFRDGTVNTIKATGERETTLVDGKTKIHQFGGVESVDPTVATRLLITNINGEVTSSATIKDSASQDGSTIQTTSDGLTIRTMKDHLTQIALQSPNATNPIQTCTLTFNDGYIVQTSGTAATYLVTRIGLPDGSVLRAVPAHPANGDTPATPGGFIIMSPDGTESGVLTSGTVNGVKYDFDGAKYTVTMPDGTLVSTDLNGVTTTTSADKKTIFNADGTVTEKNSDNSNQIRDINGDVIDTSTIDRSVTGVVTETWQKKLQKLVTLTPSGVVFDSNTKTKASTVTLGDKTRLVTSGGGDSGTIYLPDGGLIALSPQDGWVYQAPDGTQTRLVGTTGEGKDPVDNPSTDHVINGVTITATSTGGLTVRLSSGELLTLKSGGVAPTIAIPDGNASGKVYTTEGT